MTALTPREIEVVKACAHGLDSFEIAYRLACSPKSIDVYLFTIQRKLGLQRRTHIVIYALKTGLVRLEDIELPRQAEKSEVTQ